MVAGLRCNITPLIEHAVAHGGHVRVGLKDMAYGCESSSAELHAGAAQLKVNRHRNYSCEITVILHLMRRHRRTKR
jgi:hypothetical protein